MVLTTSWIRSFATSGWTETRRVVHNAEVDVAGHEIGGISGDIHEVLASSQPPLPIPLSRGCERSIEGVAVL